MIVHRTYRYRVRPETERTAGKLFALAGACRFVRNHFVAKLKADYEANGHCNWRYASKEDRHGDVGTGKAFTRLRREIPWLAEYSANIVKYSALKPLEACSKRFFKHGGGLPKFRSRNGSAPTFTCTEQTFGIADGYLRIQRLGKVRLEREGAIPAGAEPREVTVKCELGKWYAYVKCAFEVAEVPETRSRPLALDRNCGQVADSDGVIRPTPDEGRLQARLRRYQRMMARRKKGSSRRGKARHLVAKTWAKVRHVRDDWAHQLTAKLAKAHDVVFVEELPTAKMTADGRGSRDLRRDILASCWGRVERLLEYKTRLVRVNPANTSRRCAECGHVAKGNRTSQTGFKCLSCGHAHNADLNAALNILASGIGASARGGGGVGRPMKREHGLLSASI